MTPREVRLKDFIKSDAKILRKLFYLSVHNTCQGDYTKEQLNAWAPELFDYNVWLNRLTSAETTVATIEQTTAGFILTENCHIDCLFTHPNYQHMGVASALLKYAEDSTLKNNINHISTDASITAKPFFMKHGFKEVEENNVELRGQVFVNFRMIKSLSDI